MDLSILEVLPKDCYAAHRHALIRSLQQVMQPLVLHSFSSRCDLVSIIYCSVLQREGFPVPDGGGLNSWSEAFAVLSVGEAARCVIEPELCQALSQAGLQGVLFWRLRLPLLQLLGIDPPQSCPPCLDVLHAHLSVSG